MVKHPMKNMFNSIDTTHFLQHHSELIFKQQFEPQWDSIV